MSCWHAVDAEEGLINGQKEPAWRAKRWEGLLMRGDFRDSEVPR